MPSSWTAPLKGIAINLGVLLATLFIFAVILEFALRITGIQPVGPGPQVKLHQPSEVPGLVYELIPGVNEIEGFGGETISTNSLGFRGPEIDASKPTIAVLGDSYTFGFGVGNAQTNPHYLSEHFPEYNILNAGVNGYNIEQETLQYEAKIAKLDPKLVILEFVFNDTAPKGKFNDQGIVVTVPPGGTGATVGDNGREFIEAPGLINFPGKYFLHEHSALFKFIERKTKWLPFRKHASVFGSEWPPNELQYYRQWFDRLSASIGDRPKMFVIWPEVWIHLDTRRAVKQMAWEKGWLVLDLYDFYGNNYEALGWDFHPTPRMHEKVAGVMAEAIGYYGLLKR